MNPDLIMEGILKELETALKGMGNTKDLNDKETYSQIVRNLSQSLGVFFSMAADFMDFEEEI